MPLAPSAASRAQLEQEIEQEQRKAWAAPNGPESRVAIHRVKELRRQLRGAA